MRQIHMPKNIRSRGYGTKTALWAAMLATLVGCSSYENLPRQSFDSDYRVFSATNNKSGDLKLFLIKAFEDNGKVAMCGGFTRGSSALSTKLSRNWADISQIYLDDIKLGNADFMIPMPVYFKVSDDRDEIFRQLASKRPATGCVRSDVDWRPEFLDAKFERKGPNRIRGFD